MIWKLKNKMDVVKNSYTERTVYLKKERLIKNYVMFISCIAQKTQKTEKILNLEFSVKFLFVVFIFFSSQKSVLKFLFSSSFNEDLKY